MKRNVKGILLLFIILIFSMTGCTASKVNQDPQPKEPAEVAAKPEETIIRGFVESINKGDQRKAEESLAAEMTYIAKYDKEDYKLDKIDEIKAEMKDLIDDNTQFTINGIQGKEDGTGIFNGIVTDFFTDLKGVKEGIRYTTKYVVKDGKISSLEYEENKEDAAKLGKLIEGVIGMELEEDNGKVKVKACSKGYPAEKAGVKAGDLIVAVDGMKVAEMTHGLDEAVYRIRGVPGTKVNLTIDRNGEVINTEAERKNSVQ